MLRLQIGVVAVSLVCAMTADGQRCDVCTKNGVSMPISLAAGKVRTPEFRGKNTYYNIDIEARWLLPAEELRCRMGFAVSPSDNHCKTTPLFAAKWRVLDSGRTVAEGLAQGRSTSFEADHNALIRNLGSFRGQTGHRYVIELELIQDGSLLNVTQPRLIVEPPGFSF